MYILYNVYYIIIIYSLLDKQKINKKKYGRKKI